MFVILVMLASGATAGIYEWKDKDGNVHYGDRPPAHVDKGEVQTRSPGMPATHSKSMSQREREIHDRGLPENRKREMPAVVAPERVQSVGDNARNNPGPPLIGTRGVQGISFVFPATDQPKTVYGGNPPCAQEHCTDRDFTNYDFRTMSISSVAFDRSKLSGAKFRSVSSASFRDADLSNADFTGASLGSVDFSGANLAGANLSRVNCTDCTFDSANLSGANLEGIQLLASSMKGSNLIDANLKKAQLIGIDLRGARNRKDGTLDIEALGYVSGLIYRVANCDIGADGADCNGVNLQRFRFRHVSLRGVNFSKAKLPGADFTGVSGLYKIDFSGADLRNAVFPGGLITADFTGANLEGANLSHANLLRSDFSRANLRNANLTSARLDSVIFSHADTEGCKGCPDRSLRAVTGNPVNWEDALPIIKAALSEGWRLDGIDSPQERMQRLKNRGVIAGFKQFYLYLDEPDLKDALLVALRSKDADIVAVGQSVLERYSAYGWEMGRKALHAQPEFVQANLHLIGFDGPGTGTASRPYEYSTEQLIRTRAIDFIGSRVYRDASIQRQYIDRFPVEPDPRIKARLMAGFAPEYASELTPMLLDSINMDQDKLAARAFEQLARWDQPPIEALPLLVAKIQENRLEIGASLLSAFGARAAAKLPAIKSGLAAACDKGWSCGRYNAQIRDVEFLSEVTEIHNALSAEKGVVLVRMQNAFSDLAKRDEIQDVNSSHGLSVSRPSRKSAAVDEDRKGTGNPAYSTSKRKITRLLATIAGGDRVRADSVQAIATVEFEKESDSTYQTPRIGMTTILFASPLAAREASQVLLEKLESRRKLVLSENALHLVWWRDGFNPAHCRNVVWQLKKAR